jgi:hypothetical protein
MAILKLNGKTHFINVSDIKITEVGAGRFEITYDNDRTFQVLGGTKSGGSSREWFVQHELLYGDKWLPANSMVQAIKLGAQY